jgi:diketogulonate reductase-like aldo/keto reductase
MLGLGVYDMHGREAGQSVQDALEMGYQLIGTAAMYQNEPEIGMAINSSSIPGQKFSHNQIEQYGSWFEALKASTKA